MEKKLCAIGEALIDFIPQTKGQRLKDVACFQRVAGGAPANVAGAVSKLGYPSKFLTKLGDDAFGDHIIECFQRCGIETEEIVRTKEADTALAFVSLAADGNRDFLFYRRRCADQLFAPEELRDDVLKDCGMVHFCSVALVESPMKHAHIKLLDMAVEQQVFISFDPNLRFSLWAKEEDLYQAVHEFMPYANILKISDEELQFITNKTTIEEALPLLFQERTQAIVYTKGKDGASIYLKDGRCVEMPGYLVDVVDTTGAGDSFIGAYLYCLLKRGVQDITTLSNMDFQHDLAFANAYAAYTTTKAGALDAMADASQFKQFQATLIGR